MKKVVIGLLLAMVSLLLMHGNLPLIGLPAFIVGIFLMMHRKRE